MYILRKIWYAFHLIQSFFFLGILPLDYLIYCFNLSDTNLLTHCILRLKSATNFYVISKPAQSKITNKGQEENATVLKGQYYIKDKKNLKVFFFITLNKIRQC